MILNVFDNPELELAETLAQHITEYLSSNEEMLFLLAGGSAEKVYREMDKFLDGHELTGLTVAMGDERWHKDPENENVNWASLRDLPVFKMIEEQGGKIFQYIDGSDFADSAAKFNEFLQDFVERGVYILSYQGIGADGHTAGILPADAATFADNFDTHDLAVAHELGGDHPKRVTITPELIEKADGLYVYMSGNGKREILQTLVQLDAKYPGEEWKDSLHKYPALHLSGKNARIFTDIDLTE